MGGEDDVTFFESEDETWMMGDFDIDLDVDLGRPIDFEGDESVANQDESGFQNADSSGNVDPRKGTPSVSGPTPSASAQRNGAVSVSGHNNNVHNTGLNPPTNGNTNSGQRLGGSNPANPTSTGLVNSNGNGNHGNGNKEPNFQPLPNVRSGSNGNGGRTNLLNSTSNAQPSSNRPSAGGFTFPPGIVSVILLSSRALEADEPIALISCNRDNLVVLSSVFAMKQTEHFRKQTRASQQYHRP